METLEKRGKIFEDKFAHDEDLHFKILAKRAHLLGEWVTEKLWLADREAEQYINNLVEMLVEDPGDKYLINRVYMDLHHVGLQTTEIEITKKLKECEKQAKHVILHE